MNNFFKLMIAVLITLSISVFPQANGLIKGKVVDEETGEELISATVKLIDAKKAIKGGAKTKYDGSYTIKNVKPGDYSLEISYVGYQKKTISELIIKPGETRTLDITLATDAVMTEEIVITAKAVRETGAALLKERQKAAAASDAIGAEEMSKKGASDAGDALKKVTGVTVQDGKNVVVRGLTNRYAKTQLNGANLPSADPDSRSVDLDMFSTGMIENIVTVKTATPDKPGDFTGGAVDIKTKSYPDKFFANVAVSSNYNTQVTGEDLLISERQSNDLLAFDDGSRALPSQVSELVNKYGGRIPGVDRIDSDELEDQSWVDLNSDDEASDNEFFQNQELVDDYLNIRDLLNQQDMTPVQVQAPINTGISIGIGDQYKIGKSTPIGFTASLNYNRGFNSYQEGVFGNWELTNATADSLQPIDYYIEQQGQENVLISSMLGVTTTLFDYNEIGVNLIVNQASTNEGRFFTGKNPGGSGIPDKGIISQANRFTERNLFSFQLNGKHSLNFLKGIKLGKAKFDWQLASSENQRSEPNFRLFAFAYETENPSDPFNTQPDFDTLNTSTGRIFDPEVDGPYDPNRDSVYSRAYYGIPRSFGSPAIRIFRSMNETNFNFSTNLEVPLDEIIGSKFSFKTGALIERINRNFSEEWILYEPENDRFPRNDINGDEYAFDPFSNPNSPFTNLVGWDPEGDNANLSLVYRNPDRNSYTGEQNINAFYAMLDFKVFKKLRVITGARVEQSELLTLPLDRSESNLKTFQNEYADLNNLPDSLVQSITFEDFGINETDLLPSLNLVYEINKKSNLRAAYFSTLARPNLREIAPYFSFEFVGGFQTNGNPFLKRVLIENYDLRYEWFPNVGEILALSLYYKDFTNPIERGIVNENEIRFLNAESARLYGAEFELRKNLGNLVESISGTDSKFLKKLDVSFNFTLTEAQVDIPLTTRDADGLIDYEQDLLNYQRELDSLNIVNTGGNDFSNLPSTVVDTNSVLKRDFVGQSPYLINFDVSYSDPELGLNISSNFNVFGRRLNFVQLGRAPEVYELPRPELNFIISKVFLKNLKVKFSANNILNPFTQFVQTFNGEDYVQRRFRRGTAYSLSMSYRF